LPAPASSEASPDMSMPFDSAFMINPFPTWTRLREAGPAHRVTMPDGAPVWLVTRYADVRAALADPRMSLSRKHSHGTGYKGLSLPPELDANLLNMDPPNHTRLRRLVSKAFTSSRVENLCGQIQDVANELLDAIASKGRADLIASFAAPLSITVICNMLGVPIEDGHDFRSWTNALVAPDLDRSADAKTAGLAMLRYLVTLIARKRSKQNNDLLAGLIAARDNEDRLTENELVSLVFLILSAGYETSINLIGNGILTLLLRPKQLAELRVESKLLSPMVEELLRYDGPASLAIRRFPVEEVEIGGVKIPAGDTVLLSLASANRDPSRFANPDGLDGRRADNPHLAFGYGIHYCLGAPLARLEGEIAIGTVLRRFPALALAVPADQLRWRASVRSHSLRDLPVTLQ
jgi:cytochrome P450